MMKKSIIVEAPNGGYQFGESYTLMILNNLTSIDGKKLNANVKMDFSIISLSDYEDNEVVKRGNLLNNGVFISSGDWIYYKKEKLKDGETSYPDPNVEFGDFRYAQISGGWIYYLKDRAIYKMRLDGSQNTLVIGKEDTRLGTDPYTAISSIYVVNDCIYFTTSHIGLGYEIYSINTDGTELKKITDTNTTTTMQVQDEWIYYSDILFFEHGVERNIYKIKRDGTEKTLVHEGVSYEFIVDGEWIYYIAEEEITSEKTIYSIKKLNEKTGEDITLYQSPYDISAFNMNGEFIYFIVTDK